MSGKAAARPTAGPTVSSARRPDRRPAQTIRKVLDAALDELRDSSYAGLTVRSVANRAGVSPASAYKYFPSKSALVAAVYLRLLRDVPFRTDVNESTKARVTATMRDMALIVADDPELSRGCTAALMADDRAVWPVAGQIAEEVSQRLRAALGPGFPQAVSATLSVAFFGFQMWARYFPFDEVAGQLEDAVNLILGASVA